jgi:hypothetical protein
MGRFPPFNIILDFPGIGFNPAQMLRAEEFLRRILMPYEDKPGKQADLPFQEFTFLVHPGKPGPEIPYPLIGIIQS